jgi:peroxiredoxin
MTNLVSSGLRNIPRCILVHRLQAPAYYLLLPRYSEGMEPHVGDTAPDFSLLDQTGEQLSLKELVGQDWLWLVFYPLAFSPVCRRELDELGYHSAAFKARGIRVAALSVDSMHTQRAFAEAVGLEITLLADFWPHGAVAHAYGAFNETQGIAKRRSFLIDQDHRIRSVLRSSGSQPRKIEQYFDLR